MPSQWVRKFFWLPITCLLLSCATNLNVPPVDKTETPAAPSLPTGSGPTASDLVNLRGYWNAVPTGVSGANWLDLSSNGNTGLTSDGVNWSGAGTASSPYAARFTGSAGSEINFGSALLRGQTQVMFSAWVNAARLMDADEVIFGNSADGTTNGFTLRQSAASPGKFEMTVGSLGAQTCTGATVFQDGKWNHVAGILDGTNAYLYVDGRPECSVSATVGVVNSSDSFYAGATPAKTKIWTGDMASLKVYGTSDGSSVGTSANLRTDFETTANTFRAQPVGAIVSNGLVLNMDAANAAHGLSFPALGCAFTSWFDLSRSNLTGTLTNFGGCSGLGWQGDGTVANPKSLAIDNFGYVDIGTHPELDNTSITIESWVYISGYPNSDPRIFHYNNTSAGISYLLVLDSGGDQTTQSFWGGFGTNTVEGPAYSAPINTWLNLAVTYAAGTATIYANGQLQPTIANSPVYADNQGTIGCRVVSGTCSVNFTGNISIVNVYNRALSQSEISQNCAANQSRFSATSVCH